MRNEFLDKLKTVQIAKVHHDKKMGKGFFKPPDPKKGEMGLMVPSFGILEQQEVDEIAGEALEKMAKEKRIQPSQTKQVHIEHRKGGEVIIEQARRVTLSDKDVKKIRHLPLVEVFWIDAAGRAGWQSIDHDIQPSLCRTVGYLLKKNRKIVELIGTCDEHDNVCDRQVIPRSTVLKIERIK